MQSHKILSLSALIVAVTGCATSGQMLKDDKPLNVFVSPEAVKQTTLTISEMSRYCSTLQKELDIQEFPLLKKTTIDYRNKSRGDQYLYWMRIEIDETGINQSKVAVYHLMNTEVTRKMAMQVEQWVNNKSRECVRGF